MSRFEDWLDDTVDRGTPLLSDHMRPCNQRIEEMCYKLVGKPSAIGKFVMMFAVITCIPILGRGYPIGG